MNQGVDAWNTRRRTPTCPNYIDLRGANLRKVVCGGANLVHTDLSGADLSLADLSGAEMLNANLSRTNLRETTLQNAFLGGADLREANLAWANLKHARIIGTISADVDLSLTKGLDYVQHRGPSTIGIDTMLRSKGNIPEGFLRGAGVPDAFIIYARS